MYLYFIFFVLALLSYFELNFGKKFGKKLLPLLFLIFLALGTLRWERGTDWNSYLYLFKNVNAPYYKEVYESLFYLLNVIVNNFSKDYTIMLFVQSLIINILIYSNIKKYSISPVFSTFIWFAVFFGGIFFVRQTIAIAILFFSLRFIVERKIWLFMIMVIIAGNFHRSAYIFILSYFIYNLNLTRKFFIIALVSSFVFSSFAIGHLLTFFSGFDFGQFSERTEIYATDGKTNITYGSSYSSLETMYRGISYRIVILLVTLIFYYKLYQKDIFFRGVYNIYFLGLIMFILFVPVSVALIRFSSYFEIFQVFLFPYLIYQYRNKIYNNAILLVCIIYFAIRLDSNITAYKDLYIPYKSIFNKNLKVEVK